MLCLQVPVSQAPCFLLLILDLDLDPSDKAPWIKSKIKIKNARAIVSVAPAERGA
jgi:hypothetical protein